MDGWLTWRVSAPVVAVLILLPWVASPLVVDLAIVVMAALPAVSAVRVMRRVRAARLPMAFIVAAQSFAVVMTTDRLVHESSAGVVGSIAGVCSVFSYALYTLALLRARRPHDYRDGVIDGFAAGAGLLAVQWHYAALQPGITTPEVAATLTPFIGVIYLGVVIILYGTVARDARQNPALPCLLIVASVLLVAGTVGHRSYSLADAPAWSLAVALVGPYLIAAVVAHPDYGLFFLPEPPRRKALQMRWLGPGAALLATPLLMVVYVAHDRVATPGAVAVCCALTGMALWRGFRLVREREDSRRELHAEQRFRSLVEHGADVVVIVDTDLRLTYAGGGVASLLGSDTHLEGRELADVLGESELAAVIEAISQAGGTGVGVTVPRDVRLTGGAAARWAAITVTDHRNTPTIRGWVLNLHDVTGRKRAEAELARLALEDVLTGLPNRARLRAELDAAILRQPGGTAVLFCDLDGFKAVNDRLGHEAGDEVLRAVSGRWSALLRAEDQLGRWGGDEFLVVCNNIPSVETAQDVANRLAAALEEPLMLTTGSASVGVSIGVAAHEAHESADDLLARADAAMYAAKRVAGGVRTG